MIPNFKIPKDTRLYLSDLFISNGHWLLTRAVAESHISPKPIKALLALKNGTYYDGANSGPSRETTSDMTAVIPKRDGYLPLSRSPISVSFKDASDEITAYGFGCGGETVFVDPSYVPLIRMGFGFGKPVTSGRKRETNPVIVLGGDTLNDELLAVIMPMRITGDNSVPAVVAS